MNLLKKKRIQNKDLLKSYHSMKCIICGRSPCDPDHITTKGAGGDDVPSNIWNICRIHHVQRHTMGLGFMINQYKECYVWLYNNNRFDIIEKYYKTDLDVT